MKLITTALVRLVAYGILSTAGLVSSAPIDFLVNLAVKVLGG